MFRILGTSEIHLIYYEFAAFIEKVCQNLIIKKTFKMPAILLP
jgi:hypothetical protein